MITWLITWSLAFGWVNSAYAQEDEMQSAACPKNIGAVLQKSLMNNFDLWRTLQCKGWSQNTAIVKVVNWVFNVFIFPIVLLMIIWKMIKTGDGGQSGWSMGYGWGGGGWMWEGFKNYVSSKWTEIALLVIILWIWQLWFLDLFVFFIRAWLWSFWQDAWDILTT